MLSRKVKTLNTEQFADSREEGNATKSINKRNIKMVNTIISRTSDRLNQETEHVVSKWFHNSIKPMIDEFKQQLLQQDEYLSWEKTQIEQHGFWTREDCLAKAITTQFDAWPLPGGSPFWANGVRLHTDSYRELQLLFERKFELNGVTITVSQSVYVDVGEESYNTHELLFWVHNDKHPNDDFDLEQLEAIHELVLEILCLLDDSEQTFLTRKTAPGAPAFEESV